MLISSYLALLQGTLHMHARDYAKSCNPFEEISCNSELQ